MSFAVVVGINLDTPEAICVFWWKIGARVTEADYFKYFQKIGAILTNIFIFNVLKYIIFERLSLLQRSSQLCTTNLAHFPSFSV